MATSIIQRLLPRTTFDFSNETTGNAVRRIFTHAPCVSFQQAELVIRIHAGTVLGTGTSINVNAHGDGYTDEDPTTPYETSAGSTMITPSTPVPSAPIVALTPGFGPRISLTITGIQPATPATITLVLSVDLVLKNGDASGVAYGPADALGYDFE